MFERWYCPDCDVERGHEGQRWYGRCTVPACGACGTTMQLVTGDSPETDLEMVRVNKHGKSFLHCYTVSMTDETWQEVHTVQMNLDAIKGDREITVISKFGTSVMQLVNGERTFTHTANK